MRKMIQTELQLFDSENGLLPLPPNLNDLIHLYLPLFFLFIDIFIKKYKKGLGWGRGMGGVWGWVDKGTGGVILSLAEIYAKRPSFTNFFFSRCVSYDSIETQRISASSASTDKFWRLKYTTCLI